MRIAACVAAMVGSSSMAYASWLAFRPLTSAERSSWNAVYMEDEASKFRLYRRLPLNALSRAFGAVSSVQLPPALRRPLLGAYARLFGCNLCEAANPSLSSYPTAGDFFRRRLRRGARPVSPTAALVSPADGRVLAAGPVPDDGGRVRRVKGMDYSLQGFLGPFPQALVSGAGGTADPPPASIDPVRIPDPRIPDSDYYSSLLAPSGGRLHQCVIYLGPGDYHCFHSPANWIVTGRRHFPGYLMSVSPRLVDRIRGLLCLNERAVYLGDWGHGFFAFAAVGATNVGCVRVYDDPDLVTNRSDPLCPFRDLRFQQPLPQAKGQAFGEFNMGSTVVLLFEAPDGFEFCVKPGDRVLVGQALGN